MSTIIKILRSSGTTAPNALAQGELALTFGVGTQGNSGDRLFIGTGTETNGVAANIDVIGGKYFTNLTDHVTGTLTASSAILVDSNKAIDELFIGNSASTGGTIKFNEGTNNGSNFVALKSPNDVTTSHTITLPAAAGTNGQFLQVDASGVLSFANVSTDINISDDASTVITVPSSQTIKISGGTGLSSTASGSTITLDIDNTVATLTGTQTLTNKTLTTPIISSISNTGTLTLPTSTDTLVGRATTDTLTNKTLTTPIISSISNSGTITLPTATDTLVARATTDTLTNKTISGSSNTISNIANSSLDNSSITLVDDSSSTTTISLGESLKIEGGTGIDTTISGDKITIAVDGTVVTESSTDTLTNKTLTSPVLGGTTTSASGNIIFKPATNILEIQGDNSSIVGQIQLNCHVNSHGQRIASQPHSQGATNVLTLPGGSTIGNADAVLVSNTGTQTLTNKTIDGSSNTISNIGNTSLTNSFITLVDDSSSTTTISLGESLKISGDTGITATISGDTVNIDLDDTAVTPATYGSSTAIPVIIVDQQGRITSASTQNISTTLTISDDSSSTVDITLGSDTLKIAGGTGITSSISGDTITLDIDSTVVTESSTDTLTNKSISLNTNTITGTLAEFNTAVSDADFASLAGSETLTNKTISGSSNTISNIGNSSLTNSAITISDDTSSTTTISLGETLKISGGTGITSSISGDTITLDIDSTVVTESSTDTLTNKSISLSTNTITGTLAEFNTAVSDADFASLAGTETLSNKTLTAPKIVDDGFIADANGNELILFNTIGSAVNQLEISNSATGNGVTIASSGSDSNINIVLDPKGTGTVDVNSSRITSLSDPSGDQDAATKAYVDSVANGLDVKTSVRVATTAALATVTYSNGAGTLTASANGALIIDGVTVSVADRVLIKNQASAVQNGIYVVTTTGSGAAAFVLTRGPDADTAGELTGGAFFFVEEGTDNADNGYVTTFNGTPTLGTTDITFVQFSGAGQISAGNALTKTGNTLDVAVDGTTIEVSSDALRVKASGIAANELATDAVTTIKIQNSAVTNAKLANSTIFFTDESSTQGSVALGGNIEFLAGEGIDTTVIGNTVRISGELATSANAGVAFFPTDNFLVTSGSVAITKIDGGTF